MRLHFIEPGKPVQNAYIESFNEHWFTSLPLARTIVESWRNDYHAVRPHSALGIRTPEEFAHHVARNTPVGLYQTLDLIQGAGQ